MVEITYAKAGGPPDNWLDLMVIDFDTGEMLDFVVEVNTVEGWADCYDKTEQIYQSPNGYEIKRVHGNFKIVEVRER